MVRTDDQGCGSKWSGPGYIFRIRPQEKTGCGPVQPNFVLILFNLIVKLQILPRYNNYPYICYFSGSRFFNDRDRRHGDGFPGGGNPDPT